MCVSGISQPKNVKKRTDGATVDALDNDSIQIDFKPLYQCMHIYEALGLKVELQRNYQEDRKVGLEVI